MIDAVRTAWAAGLFEGEGCIEISGRQAQNVRLRVNMTDRDVIEKFAEIAGCGTVREVRAPSIVQHQNWKQTWGWSISQGDECRRLLQLWLPHLGRRRGERAREALTFLAQKTYDRYRTCYCGKHYVAERCNNREFCSPRCREEWKATLRREAVA